MQCYLEYFVCVVGQQQVVFVFWFLQVGLVGDSFWVNCFVVDVDGCCFLDIGDGVVVIWIEWFIQYLWIEVVEVSQFVFIDFLQYVFFVYFVDKVG